MSYLPQFDFIPEEVEGLEHLDDSVAGGYAFEEMFPPAAAPSTLLTASAGDVSALGIALYLNAGKLYAHTPVGGDLRVHLTAGALSAS